MSSRVLEECIFERSRRKVTQRRLFLMSAYLIFNFIYNESLKTGGSYSRKTITLTDDKDTISSFIITLFLDFELSGLFFL